MRAEARLLPLRQLRIQKSNEAGNDSSAETRAVFGAKPDPGTWQRKKRISPYPWENVCYPGGIANAGGTTVKRFCHRALHGLKDRMNT